jgi:hypothetical protein
VAASPIFAAIAVRDTTPTQPCDTLIEKNGAASSVKILSVDNVFITYKLCSNNAKRIYTIDRSKIREIKSSTFIQPQAKPIPLLTRAKRAFRTAFISATLFLVSLGLVAPTFGGDSGEESILLNMAFIALLITPLIIVGSFFYNISVLDKAQKAKDKKAVDLATGGIIISLLPILIILGIFLL